MFSARSVPRGSFPGPVPKALVGLVPLFMGTVPGDVDAEEGGEACGISAGEGMAVPTVC